MTAMKQKIKDFIARFLLPVQKKMTEIKQKIKPFFASISRFVCENPPRWKYVKKNLSFLFSELIVGLPFVGYKIFAGLIIWNMYPDSPVARVVGSFFFVLGWGDMCVHAVNLFGVFFKGKRLLPVCILAIVNRKMRCFALREEIGEAVDMMISFAIVATVVGNELFVFLEPYQIKLWNCCTVFNILGAGISQLQATLRTEWREQHEKAEKQTGDKKDKAKKKS